MKRLMPMIVMGFAVTLLQLTPAARAQKKTMPAQREVLTKAQFDEVFKQVSNWGRWGKEDQLGTLNLITPERRREAAALVREGVSVSLARDLNAEKAIDNPDPFRDTMNLGVDGKFNMDTYTVNFHGFAFSHFDALSHTYYNGHLYNGFPDTSITSSGASVLDAALYKDGIFTRGVLVDIPWLRGLPYLDKDAYITAHDLDLWEAKTGVHIRSGDAVIIRTGRWALREAKGPWDIANASAGLDPSAIVWLHKRDVAFLVSDAAHDAIPSAVNGVDFPIHVLAIVAMGMPLADQCNLEDIAREAQKVKRETFLLTLAPVRIKGGTGALINPIATF
jgi:kynurenine formamidase